MKIYNYDGQTKRFLGWSIADPDPVIQGLIAERAVRVHQQAMNAEARAAQALSLSPGASPSLPFPEAKDPLEIPSDLVTEYHLPAHSTTIEPPLAAAVPEGMFPCFDEEANAWRLTPIATAHGEVEPAVDPMSQEGKKLAREAILKKIADEHLDAVATGSGFHSMADAVTYADDDTIASYQLLGASLRKYRSTFRAAVAKALADIDAGTVPVPADAAEWLAMLPEFKVLSENPEMNPVHVPTGSVELQPAPQQHLETVDSAHPPAVDAPKAAAPMPAPQPVKAAAKA